MKARMGMLTQANISTDRTHMIVGAQKQALSEGVKAQLPDMETLKRSIRH